MKVFIFTIGMVILYVLFLTYQTDNNTFTRQLEHLKYVADECAASASLYYEKEQRSNGYTIYLKDEGIKAIEYILESSLLLDSSLDPLIDSYWLDRVEYDVYFYDNSNTKLPYLYIDTRTNYQKLITEPTVIVTIESKPRFRLNFLNQQRAIRTSAYEYFER